MMDAAPFKTAAGAMAVVMVLAVGGWAAAGAPRAGHVSASDGRVLQVSYQVVREPPYTPPPATEATRLDVLDASAPTLVEDGVLSAQAGDALRAMQADEAARSDAALAQVRAEDARIDQDTTSALAAVHGAPAATPDPEA